MRYEDRVELSNQLTEVIKDYLSPKLCAGTGKDFRERKQEMARIMVRVSAIVLFDKLPDSERVFRTKQLENEAMRSLDQVGHNIWVTKE